MTISRAVRLRLGSVAVLLLPAAAPTPVYAIEMRIIQPAVPLMVRYDEETWECEVDEIGDEGVEVTWTWEDETGDVQSGTNLFQVQHLTPNAGRWTVTCDVYDPVSQESDSDFLVFGVLWVELDLQTLEASKDNGGYVDPFDSNQQQQAAYRWFLLRFPRRTSLGLGPVRFGLGGGAYKYGVELRGDTTPSDWGDVIFNLENPVKLFRKMGPLGGKYWNGPQGAQEGGGKAEEADDTSEWVWRDDGPTSDYTWPDEAGIPWRGETFESGGVVYDIDYPGYSDSTNNHICRIRANFVQWAVWEYGGDAKCSDDLNWHVAMSCRWTGQDFELVNDVADDNDLGEMHLPSLNWNGPLRPLQ